MSDRERIEVRWYGTIALKLALALTFLVALSIGLFAFETLREEARHTEKELLKTGMFVARTLARQAALHVQRGDRAALENLLGAFDPATRTPDARRYVSHAAIVDRAGRILARTGTPEGAASEPFGHRPLPPAADRGSVAHRIDPTHVEIHAPIVHAGETIGRLRLGITQAHRQELLDAVRGRTLRTMALLSVAAALIGFLVGRRFVRPLTWLTESARRIGAQQWGQTVAVRRSDEIGELAHTFNEMSVRLKRAFEDSQQATRRLVQADKFAALGTLSSTLAHELRNPLTAIKMILEAALEDGDRADCTRQDLEVMLHEVQRMESTVNGILGLAGPQRVDLDVRDLNGVIRDLFTLVRHRLEAAGITATLKLDERVPAFSFDAKRVEQMLLNLVVNAVDAMANGGTLAIRTEWHPAPAAVRILVQDGGVGIPAGIRNRIFDPFFTTKENGTGIGLSVAYTVVRDHGGEIEVESEPGAGSCFVITLPVKGESAPCTAS